MKKFMALFAVVIVGGFIIFTSINAGSKGNQATQQVTLKNGDTIQLTDKEAALIPSKEEKEVMLLNLGMT